jgi:hypothetical protein
MKMHEMNRNRSKECFNPIRSNLSGTIDSYYRYIESYKYESLIPRICQIIIGRNLLIW